ncbi:F-box protein SKIP23 [Cocos nucifera]|uniref:F-box protein SKIP23 n=1 Tax=Cocos nucifera TaxID=13894 RepID=A0A8K0N3C7_COCNU|nr:F-box protein SKIP23 [Cocos nucifera]
MASSSSKRRVEEEGPHWSHLPTDLLELIAKKLVLIADYIHFRAVCKSWRSAALPANLRPQPPLLLLPYCCLTDVRPFFSLATNSVRTLSIPESYGQVILASSHGWLLMLRGTALSLLNPVTRAQIWLPPPTDFYLPGRSATQGGGRNSISFIWNASLFSSPSSRAHDCVIIIMVHNWSSGKRHVHFCRLGDSFWTELKTDSPAPLDSVVYDDGRFYTLDIDGIVTVYAAAATCKSIFSVPPPIAAAKFLLVKASETELLLLARDSSFLDPSFLYRDYDVKEDLKLFKLDLSGRLLRWSVIESIEDKALFSAEDHCSMICVSDFPGFREDCMYFEAPYDIFQRFKSKFHHIEVLNLKDGSHEFIWCGWEKPSNDSMKPIWFAPSLC